jgi:nitrite reductase/ring-hydroxylating ferredoxin subunit
VRSVAHGSLTRLLETAWHPVLRAEQLQGRQPAAVRLLGRDVVVARVGDGRLAALEDRCLHRSTPLSLGTVDERGVRCAAHGWVWAPDGACVEIPGQAAPTLPARARVATFSAREAAGLVWVRLDDRAPWPLPEPPGPAPEVTVVSIAGVGAMRRIEHLLEAACGSWSTGGSAAARIERRGPEVRVAVTASPLSLGPSAPAEVTVVLPTSIEVVETAGDGGRLWFWACAVPAAVGESSLVWAVGGDDLDPAVRRRISEQLGAAEALLTSKRPAELVVDHSTEVSVAADQASVAYRRALHEAAEAARRGPGPLAAWIGAATGPARSTAVAAARPMA